MQDIIVGDRAASLDEEDTENTEQTEGETAYGEERGPKGKQRKEMAATWREGRRRKRQRAVWRESQRESKGGIRLDGVRRTR